MNKLTIFCALLFSLTFFLNLSYADVYNIAEMTKSSVRVTAKKRLGSGTVFSSSKDKYFILTNAHVVGGSSTANIDLFADGKHQKRVTGKIIWKYLSERKRIDLAIIEIEKKALGAYRPKVIKLAPKGTKVKARDTIYSIGFPHGRWPMAWLGNIQPKIHTPTDAHILNFMPTPFEGQSGSALLANIDNETRIVGIIGWKTQEDSIGYGGRLRGNGFAMNISILHDLLGE